MPICMREGSSGEQETKKSNEDERAYHDNEEVFYCETTKKIFRDYEAYFRHVMLINSTIWVCESTGKENLTYAEAVKSEKRFRKRIEAFPDLMKGAILLVIDKSQQSSVKELIKLCYQFIRDRHFIGEKLQACSSSTMYSPYKIVGIKPKNKDTYSKSDVHDNNTVDYVLQRLDKDEELISPASKLRRTRQDFSQEIIQMFVKDSLRRVEGILKPKPEAYKKYVTDAGFSLQNNFVGVMPEFKASKARVVGDKTKKQATLSKYFKNDNGGKAEQKPSKADAEKTKSLKAEMERVKREKEMEKEKKIEEEAKRKAEVAQKIEELMASILKKSEDLERRDQKPMPLYREIQTVIPTRYLGDCFTLQEFLHSFNGFLSGYEVFKNNITFFDITRAFTTREVAGPLSDIFLILLGTIFDLQKEEEEECLIEYCKPKILDKEPYTTIALATKTHEYVKTHFSFKLNQLPIDCQTFSEVLRLHLLASGSNTTEKGEKWRCMYRNGYLCSGDPGLWLRIKCPHILRALKTHSVFQLPLVDIFRIIHCLIDQILTYSSSVNAIDERMDVLAKAKIELRALMASENKRMAAVQTDKRKLQAEFVKHCDENNIKSDDPKRKYLEDKLNKQIGEIIAASDREKKKFDNQVENVQNSLFDHLVLLGTDRAYRKYYVFESIPGIFIEHPAECYESCLTNPPSNWTELIDIPKNNKEIKAFLTKHFNSKDPIVKSKTKINVDTEADKENKQTVNGKLEAGDEVQLPPPIVMINGVAKPYERINGDTKQEDSLDLSPYDIMMCTGIKAHCIVHDEKNSDRKRWSYIYTEEEVEALIDSLNPLGEREGVLREQIRSFKTLILNHIKKCPATYLSLSDDTAVLKFNAQMMQETNKKYANSNFSFEINANLEDVMYKSLIDRILTFEFDVTTGFLGKLKVKDLEKWRLDLEANEYDPQFALTYGTENSKVMVDPGNHLSETMEIDSEDSSDECFSLHDSAEVRTSVQNMASALLQIEQSLEQRFLNDPFGVTKDSKDNDVNESRLAKGRECLKRWETSLMASSSYSQVFLHLSVIHDSVKWARSVNKSACQICRRKSDPEKMLLCDECNGGTHMFCMKPKLKTVPDGNWYCHKCVAAFGYSNGGVVEKKNTRKRNTFLLDDEDNRSESSTSGSLRPHRNRKLKVAQIEEQVAVDDSEPEEDEVEEEQMEEHENMTLGEDENEAEEETDEDVCTVCSYDGGELSCFSCKSVFHLECAELRRLPRSNWSCPKCKTKDDKKRKSRLDSSSDSEEPQVKRSKQPSKRSSTRNSLPSPKEEQLKASNNNNSRRSRRTGDNLPLNSVILYELLDDISKHEDAWPFLRPVTSAEVPDYFDIIKNPMDFAKVKSKLNMGQYRINEELLKDIQLVFNNCDTYNEEGNEIYSAGEKLEQFIMEKCKDLGLPYIPSDMNTL